jgi:hypothetical protein
VRRLSNQNRKEVLIFCGTPGKGDTGKPPMIGAFFGKDDTRQLSVFETCLLKRYLRSDESPQMDMRIVFAIGGKARRLPTN